MRYIYLHGFASGPGSRKAQAFATALRAAQQPLEIPDLAEGDFERLTITRQLGVLEDLVGDHPARLIGSSMGGYLAALFASTHASVTRLVLLAPAFGLARSFEDEAWKRTGWRDFYHYSDARVRRVHYGLVEDARRYPEDPVAFCPTNIYHGTSDTVVPVASSAAWAADAKKRGVSAELRLLDTDHEMTGVLDAILSDAVPFLLS